MSNGDGGRNRALELLQSRAGQAGTGPDRGGDLGRVLQVLLRTESLGQGHVSRLSDFRIYGARGEVVVHHVALYEGLNLPEKIELPRVKSSTREDRRHYREVMGREERHSRRDLRQGDRILRLRLPTSESRFVTRTGERQPAGNGSAQAGGGGLLQDHPGPWWFRSRLCR